MSLISEETPVVVTSSDWFVHAALHYRYNEMGFTELCDHNANVASEMGMDSLSKSWLTLKILYGYFNFDRSIKAVAWPQPRLNGHGNQVDEDGEKTSEGRDRKRHPSKGKNQSSSHRSEKERNGDDDLSDAESKSDHGKQ